MSPRPRRSEQRSDLKQAIKESAWKSIALGGASSLSLRAIARELGITAPAIYNYFSDRDALVTALIIDAYGSFGDSQLAARQAMAGRDLAVQLVAMGNAYRSWALAHPQWYQLIFGTPIPGYVMPKEEVRPASSRAIGALIGVVEDLRRAGRLLVHNIPPVQKDSRPSFERWIESSKAHAHSLAVALLFWARAHGLVSLEISGMLVPFEPDGGGLYRLELELWVKQLVKPRSVDAHDRRST